MGGGGGGLGFFVRVRLCSGGKIYYFCDSTENNSLC